ncbi:hypothetical protein D3C80_2060120 [compost metagenome]
MNIIYRHNKDVSLEDVIRVFRNSGIARRTDQSERIQAMISNADILITAWLGDRDGSWLYYFYLAKKGTAYCIRTLYRLYAFSPKYR